MLYYIHKKGEEEKNTLVSKSKELNDDEEKLLEESDCQSRVDYQMSIGKIMANQECIERYFDLCQELQEKGLDPKKVLNKKDDVRSFFVISKKLLRES